GPTHGKLTLIADGTFTYTPAAGFNGVDHFSYRANDGVATSNIATVSMVVGKNPAGGTIAGSIFDDANVNARRDTEEQPLAGWTVWLDKNQNGKLDSGEPKTMSDMMGGYRFNGLG